MLRGVGVAQTAQCFNHVGLGVGLTAVDDVVNGPGAAEVRVVRLPVFGRDPAGVIAVGKERSAPRCTVTMV